MMNEKLAIGSDEKRIYIKERIKSNLCKLNIEFEDFGEGSYVDIARIVAENVAQGNYTRGILICRTGIGMQIVANKIPGAYAVRCWDEKSAQDSRMINNSNILTLGEDLDPSLEERIVKTWLQTKFQDNPRYSEDLVKIKNLEIEYAKQRFCS